MKAVVAAFNQEKALVEAFSVITNLRMELFEALVTTLPSQSSHTTLGKGDTELYTIHTIEFQIHTRYIQLLYYRYCICTINPKHNMSRDIMEWRIFWFLDLDRRSKTKLKSFVILFRKFIWKMSLEKWCHMKYIYYISKQWVIRLDLLWHI